MVVSCFLMGAGGYGVIKTFLNWSIDIGSKYLHEYFYFIANVDVFVVYFRWYGYRRGDACSSTDASSHSHPCPATVSEYQLLFIIDFI